MAAIATMLTTIGITTPAAHADEATDMFVF